MYLSRPKFWKTINIFSLALIPFSFLYFFIILFKNVIFFKSRKVKPFVICVGNVTVGGTGKTPVCLELGRFLRDRGFNVTYLTRGVGGNGSYVGKVDNKIHSAFDVGDEAIMLSKIASTYIGRNRFTAGKLAELDGADIIIMDDGMQNQSIYKDITLLVFDSEYKFGNKLLLPAGPLREPLSWAFKKADFFVCTSSGDRKENTYLEEELKQSFSFEYIVKNIDEVKGKKFIGLSSIADPEKFIRTAKKFGAEILELISYHDHHNYSEGEIEEVLKIAKKHNCMILTTSKDAVKIHEKHFHNIVVLDLFMEDHDNLNDAILNVIPKS